MATYTDNYNLIKPSYSEIADVATINTNMNTIDDIMHSTQISLAPAYDSTKTYNTDDVVMYELLMYKCKENGVTGTWDASKWERTTAGEHGGGGGGGSSVVPNPQGTPTDTLTTVEIDGTIFDIAGSGSGGDKGYDSTLLWDSGSTTVGAVYATDYTFLDNLSNYDQIILMVSTNGDRADANHQYTQQIWLDVEYILSTGSWHNVNVAGYGTRYFEAEFTDTTFRVIQGDGDGNYKPTIYQIYGIKFGSGGGSDVEVTQIQTEGKAVASIAVDGVSTDILVPELKVYGEASGSIAEFDDGSNKPMSKCIVEIKAVQSGSGDPSPTNVRPISGFTEANIVVSPTANAQDGTTYSVSWESEAGIVYGGTLDVVSGELVVDMAMYVADGSESVQSVRYHTSGLYFTVVKGNLGAKATNPLLISSRFKAQSNVDVAVGNCYVTSAGQLLVAVLPDQTATTKEAVTQWFADNPTQFVYELATPLTYQLTPIQVNSLLGINKVWNDTNGETEVKYRRDIEMLLQRIADSLGGNQ